MTFPDDFDYWEAQFGHCRHDVEDLIISRGHFLCQECNLYIAPAPADKRLMNEPRES